MSESIFNFILNLLSILFTMESAAAIVIICYHGRPILNFILRMCGKKVINGNHQGPGREEFEAHKVQDNDNIKQIFERISGVEVKVGSLESSVKHVDEGVSRIETILMEKGAGK